MVVLNVLTLLVPSWVRGDRRDFDVWAHKYGCAGWSADDVLPYFKRAENFERARDLFH